MNFPDSASEPGPGFWQRDTAHFPAGISRHLWELLVPAYDSGARLGFARYGSVIDHMDIARIKGRQYLRPVYVEDAGELSRRRRTAELALANKLWREDREAWPGIRDGFRCRLLSLARQNPEEMDSVGILKYLKELRSVFHEGVCQHFVQQPSSTIPVGDWLQRTCEWTGASLSEIVPVLRNCRQPADFLQSLDAVAALVRSSSEALKLLQDLSENPSSAIEKVRAVSPQLKELVDAYMDEYANRLVTGFDLTDATLRELPESILSVLRSRVDFHGVSSIPDPEQTVERIRARVPAQYLAEFEEGFLEARAAYGLHDDDVRITYLWPLGLMRRAMMVVASQLHARGLLREPDHVFHTTPEELDALITGLTVTAGDARPSVDDLAGRALESMEWSKSELPMTFGDIESDTMPAIGAASNRIDSAIAFYLNQMESHRHAVSRPEWILVDGIAASPGRYEGYARVIHGPSDFERLRKGDVLVVRSTSPAYNLLLPIIGAVVTDRGGALCHSAIIAREFGIPAVVGTSLGTRLIPDGARVLVDGDRGFVAVQS